jgi:hypothetical protein
VGLDVLGRQEKGELPADFTENFDRRAAQIKETDKGRFT